MVDAAGVRVAWADLPAPVRDVVADILGSPVLAAVSQPGGFSPGSADRVCTADGRRAFVKAVSGLVDWPWATCGAGWFDRVALLVNVGLYDADAPLDDLLASWLPDVAADDVDAVLSGLAAYFVDVARRPDPPGLPTVRAFQRAQGAVVLRWLRRRWSIGSLP